VLVTGANGYIGLAVCKAFSLSGWTTYGLIRSEKSIPYLIREEAIPIIGTADNPAFISELPVIDVIVVCSGDASNFDTHYDDIIRLSQRISKIAKDNGHGKPLVIVSSSCKDYGTGLKQGEPGFAPHTEKSPLNYPRVLHTRATGALKMLNYSDEFDAAIARPTSLYGHSSSFYAYFFYLAELAKTQNDGVWYIPASPNTALHSLHIDDTGAAYLAIAEAPREVVAGQAYNMAAHRYETLEEIAKTVEKSHGIRVEYEAPLTSGKNAFAMNLLFNFSQWVGSDKLRKDTGWTDKKPLFHEAYEVFRKSYELEAQQKTENYGRVRRNAPGVDAVQAKLS